MTAGRHFLQMGARASRVSMAGAANFGGSGQSFNATSVLLGGTGAYAPAGTATSSGALLLGGSGQVVPRGIAIARVAIAASSTSSLGLGGFSTTSNQIDTIPTITFTFGTASSVNLATLYVSWFNASQHVMSLATGSTALPTGVTLSTAGLLSYDGVGAVTTVTGVKVAVDFTAEASWTSRSVAAGVTNADRFDSPVLVGATGFPGYYRSGGGTTPLRAVADTSIRVSGAQSLRMNCVDSGADQAGQYIIPLGATFGQNSTFYVQYRWRCTPAWLTSRNGGGPKMSILCFNTNSCSDVELTIQNQFYSDFWRGYSHCGATNFPLIATVNLVADVWWTVYLRVHVGTWFGFDSQVQGWFGLAGASSLTQVIETGPNFKIENQPPEFPGFNVMTFLPYDTGVTGAPPANSQCWYDEFICSTQPIAVPTGTPLGG